MSSLFGIGANGASDFYTTKIDQSLRFEDGDSPRLDRTPSSETDRDKFTWSSWIKRGALDQLQMIFQHGANNNNSTSLFIESNNTLAYQHADGGGATDKVQTNSVLRDQTNFYHIALAVDTTQSTDSNRVRLYINGVYQSSLATANYPTQNTDTDVNTTNKFRISGQTAGTQFPLDGYMAEVNFLDGIQVGDTQDSDGNYILDEFGLVKNGVWIPKEYSGSYGTNGFRLTFADSSSLGDDTSGNGNDFTSSGLASTDVVLDSPTNNFCTLNPLNANDHRGEATFSRGNLRMVSSSTNRGFTTGTMKIHGKVYFEVLSRDGNNGFVGIADIENAVSGNSAGQSLDMYNGTPRIDGSALSGTGTFSDGDIMGVAVDVDAKSIEFFRNNSSVFSATYSQDAEYFPFLHDSSGGRSSDFVANFGQDSSFTGEKTSGSANAQDDNNQGDFFYAPPSGGFLALCSANLPDTTISPNESTQADDHFNTVLYDGDSSTQSVTGVGFQPDWLWIKSRNTAASHTLNDSSRGVTLSLFSNAPNAEVEYSATSGNGEGITTFGTDGFTVKHDATNNQFNVSGRTYVGWNWKANGGITSSNGNGSKTSTVQANIKAGFSIVLYSGDTSSFTVGHGLNSAPEWVIVKSRTHSERWAVFHTSISNQYIYLNESFAGETSNADERFGNSTSVVVPNSTVVTLGANNSDVSKNGEDYVMYCFHSVEGYSKFGSYTGNSSTDGAFVYTGFRPAWILVKRTASGNWYMYDNKRNKHNVVNLELNPNTNQPEATFTTLDFLSNGFKLRTSNDAFNVNTYIYMAFAEQPFKFSNAR